MKAKFRKLITFAKWAGPLVVLGYWLVVYADGLAEFLGLFE